MTNQTSIPSYVCGTGNTPLLYQTIGEAFDATATAHGHRDALIVRHQSVRWTYDKLAREVCQLAAGMLELGLAPGDRLGIWAPNCVEWVVTQLACAKAGIILVTINPAYRSGELEYALNLSGCTALVLAEKFRSSDYVSMLHELAPEITMGTSGQLRAARLPHLRWPILIGSAPPRGFLSYRDLASAGSANSLRRLEHLSSSLKPEDPISVQFTSGTTGLPKGATLTHHNMLNNGRMVGRRMNCTSEDRLCIPVPLYHCFGMVLGVLNCISRGAAMVFPSDFFDPRMVLETVAAERCTLLFGVPTMFIAELEHPDFRKFDLSSLRAGLMGGSPCPVEVMKRIITDMHMSEAAIVYGMTETGPVSFQTLPTASLDQRVNTVGAVHPFVEAMLVDAKGRVVPRGQPGELLVRGYSVMSGYWGDPERTAEAIDKIGWMHTGDLATFDADGHCKIVGRVKDMIIRGGENIYPSEIEAFLRQHPSVLDVAVFGVPDAKFGEEVCAWIRLREGAISNSDDIIAFCRERIAHYKVPRVVRFVDGFPMTVTGKLQKYLMREAMRRELGREEAVTA